MRDPRGELSRVAREPDCETPVDAPEFRKSSFSLPEPAIRLLSNLTANHYAYGIEWVVENTKDTLLFDLQR